MKDSKNIKNKIREIYSRYGFREEKPYDDDNVIVFSLKAGYFSNIDIIPISEKFNSQKAFKDFTELGFACTVREYQNPENVEKNLFNGFFSIESNKKRLEQDYERFTSSIVKHFDSNATYEYLNAPYIIDGKNGEKGLVQDILEKIQTNIPTLILIEAAAGFGKTCASYELVSKINAMEDKIPLFAELSRNRQARIFKHILLDEIDRTFPLLSSRLVQQEILNGRVITILDGFDELLRDGNETNDFNNREPMLETIGDYLKNNAKIILTTRRTILFEGDEFHKWVEKNETEFELVKIKINEPRIKDWLDYERLELLKSTGIEINNIANPVLLSFLRCIPFERLKVICNDPENIVESYFSFMLEREQVRQELFLDVESQNKILESIAEDMINYQYTSEDREYIVSLILENNLKIIEKAINNYPPQNRPTRDEVANKLASHALLDRSSRNPNKIGFVNEFVLGNYVAKNILKHKDWLNDDWSFLEPALISYSPRSENTRLNLWKKLEETANFLSYTDKSILYLSLKKTFDLVIDNGEIDSIELNNVLIGEKSINNSIFNECVFNNCIFNLVNLQKTTFLNCRFFNCHIKDEIKNNSIYILGSEGDFDFINKFKSLIQTEDNDNVPTEEKISVAEKYVLERFWPKGRDSITFKHRPIKGICTNNAYISPEELYDAIISLKRKQILLEPRSPSFVEINFEKTSEIKELLGR